MRLVRVKAPEGKGEAVAGLAFDADLEQVTLHQQSTLKSDGRRETKDVLGVETATPTAKVFVDVFLVNVVTIIAAAFVTYALVGMRGDALERFSESSVKAE